MTNTALVGPNHSGSRLRRIRLDAGLSQTRFATLVRQAGRQLGQPNECTRIMVQGWEEGKLASCEELYREALALATGVPFGSLCPSWPRAPYSPVVDVLAPMGLAFGLQLRAWREGHYLSQSRFAESVRKVGGSMGEPNECSKRLVQKWESGEHARVRQNYARVLFKMTGIPMDVMNTVGLSKVARDRNGRLPQSAPFTVLELLDTYAAQLAELRLYIIRGEADKDTPTGTVRLL